MYIEVEPLYGHVLWIITSDKTITDRDILLLAAYGTSAMVQILLLAANQESGQCILQI